MSPASFLGFLLCESLGFSRFLFCLSLLLRLFLLKTLLFLFSSLRGCLCSLFFSLSRSSSLFLSFLCLGGSFLVGFFLGFSRLFSLLLHLFGFFHGVL